MSEPGLHFARSIDFYLLVFTVVAIVTFWSRYVLFLLLMLLFPAANISCCDFCVKEMRSKGAELHHVEVSGGAGLGAGMGWYLLTLIRWQEEWTVNELLGKVPEVASINEFERLEKTKNREEKMHGNGILHWIGSSHPCPWSINSQTWLCLRIFPSLQLWKCDWVLSRGRGQWLLGWVPPTGRGFWTLLIEGLSKMNWPWPVIQLSAQHGLVHSTNVLWKHIVSSCLMAGPFLVIELRKLGKGRRVGLEEERGKRRRKMWLIKNFLICSYQFSWL